MSDKTHPAAELINEQTGIHLKIPEGDIQADDSIYEVQQELCAVKIMATEHISGTADIQHNNMDIKVSVHHGLTLNNSEGSDENRVHDCIYDVNQQFFDNKGKGSGPINGTNDVRSNTLEDIPVNSFLSLNKLAGIDKNHVHKIKQEPICEKETINETSSIQSLESDVPVDSLSLNNFEVIYENHVDYSIKVKQEFPNLKETTIQSTAADLLVDVSSKDLEETNENSVNEVENSQLKFDDDVIMVMDKDDSSLSLNKLAGIVENHIHKIKQEPICEKETINETSSIQSLESDVSVDSSLSLNSSEVINNHMDFSILKVKQEFPNLKETTVQPFVADLPVDISSKVLEKINQNPINEVENSQLELDDDYIMIMDKDEFINNSTKTKTGSNVDTRPVQTWTAAFKNFIEIYSESEEETDEMCTLDPVEAEITILEKNGNSLEKNATNDADIVNQHDYREILLDSASDSDCDSSSSVSDSSSDLTSAIDSSLSDDEIEKPTKKKLPVPHTAKKKKNTSDYEELPQIHELEISLDEKAELMLLGSVSSIIDTKVVILSDANTPALNLDSVVFLENREPLGQIFDVFGRVENPRYVVLLSSTEDIDKRGVTCGSKIYYAPEVAEVTNYVFVNHLQKEKGSDASWEQDKEPPEKYLDFSDDEKEKQAKAKRRNRNKVDENGCTILMNGTKRRRKEIFNRRNVPENVAEVIPVFDSVAQFSEAMIVATTKAVSRIHWKQRPYALQASRFQPRVSFESNLSRGFGHHSPRGFRSSFPAHNIHQFGQPPQFRPAVTSQIPPFLTNTMARPRHFPFLPQRFSNSASDIGFRPPPPFFQTPRFGSVFGSPHPTGRQGFSDESYNPFGQSPVHSP